MELRASGLDVIRDYVRGEVLCLSYPHVLVPFEAAKEIYPSLTKTSELGKLDGIDEALPDTTELLTAMGAKAVRYVDAHASRIGEGVADLNEPQELGLYDLVIDPGATEHCFNVGQALCNAAKAVRWGGHVFHASPASRINHGFWNFSPTLFWDFYTQNGFQVLGMWYERNNDLLPAPATQRSAIEPEISLYCLAQKVEDVILRYPTQGKYLKATAPAAPTSLSCAGGFSNGVLILS